MGALSNAPSGSRLLGTLTTVSGVSHVLSGLNLKPFQFLWIRFAGVSFNSGAILTLEGVDISQSTGGAATSITGSVLLALSVGDGISTNIISGGGADVSSVVETALSKASSSLTFSGGTFDAGSIEIYGVA